MDDENVMSSSSRHQMTRPKVENMIATTEPRAEQTARSFDLAGDGHKPLPQRAPILRVATDQFSVVVPFYNEAANVRYVLEEVRAELPDAEIIAVDDGSTDETWARIQAIPGVRGLRLTRNLGQSGAIYHGLRACTRPVCGLMDGDGQNDPANFHRLLVEFQRGGADVVCGFRENRNDTWSRRAASRFANGIRRRWLDDGVRDTGCSQKVFRREAADLLVPFRGMHIISPPFSNRPG